MPFYIGLFEKNYKITFLTVFDGHLPLFAPVLVVQNFS